MGGHEGGLSSAVILISLDIIGRIRALRCVKRKAPAMTMAASRRSLTYINDRKSVSSANEISGNACGAKRDFNGFRS
jgi:hypothetical protein